MKVMKMTSIQWKNLNNWKIRQWLTWQESSRTSGLEGTQNTSLKVDLTTMDPVAQGSEVTEVDNLQGLTTNLSTRQGW